MVKKQTKAEALNELRSFFFTRGDFERMVEEIISAIRGPDIFGDWPELQAEIRAELTTQAFYDWETAFEWLKRNYTAKIRAAILPNFPGEYDATPIRTKDLNLLKKITKFVKEKESENNYKDPVMRAYRHWIQHLLSAATWIVKRNRT